MDDDYIFGTEKQSIRESGRTLKKYGSTCNHVRNNETLIRHEVNKSDTLQGIALKYGCTTEQIRRANRLFASDSLFLRQYLLIPVEKTSPYYPKDDRPQSFPSVTFPMSDAPPTSASSEQTLQQQFQESLHQQNNRNTSKSMDSMSTTSPTSTLSPEEENRKCMDEFLGKIDNTIAASREYVAKSQSSDLISNQYTEDIFTTDGVEKRRNSNSNNNNTSKTSHPKYVQHTRHSSSGSYSDTAQLLNITQGRRVQNSLQRLEKQQDEFFEL